MFIDARLLRFWEARNVKRGGELMWLDLLLVDVNKREIFHDSAPLLWHSVESNYHNNTLAAGSGKKTMQEVLLNRYDCTSMEESLRIPDSLKFNNDACTRINSMIIPCCEDLIEPKSDHSHKVIEITNIAWKYLLDENLVNEASCSTPMKRPNDIPSIESTEELRIQASKTYRERFNFQDGKLLKQASGDAKQQHQQQQHLTRASSVY
ncbi:kinesin-like protein KIN-5D isoform X1 [Brassica napus]|uniref:(rape) hypothetical protein n=1 Tax=Brassica napus TaxID=3708 RepID=A0A816QCY3_BRANA|nr:kinesin-like protein KIN-5D isoform X1 [Brassica napus]XP_013750035.1 kinesin-like protein KIN-5D isoform X1 [Brassica napus]CAF2058438.1 unnamed protein product [Brassica napus]